MEASFQSSIFLVWKICKKPSNNIVNINIAVAELKNTDLRWSKRDGPLWAVLIFKPLPDEAPIWREEGQDDVWITNKIRKNVEKRIRVLKQQQSNIQTQANNLNNIDVVRLNLLRQIHPFILECQKRFN